MYENRSGHELHKNEITEYTYQPGIYDTDIGDFVLPVLVDATKVSVTVVTPIMDCLLLPYSTSHTTQQVLGTCT